MAKYNRYWFRCIRQLNSTVSLILKLQKYLNLGRQTAYSSCTFCLKACFSRSNSNWAVTWSPFKESSAVRDWSKPVEPLCLTNNFYDPCPVWTKSQIIKVMFDQSHRLPKSGLIEVMFEQSHVWQKSHLTKVAALQVLNSQNQRLTNPEFTNPEFTIFTNVFLTKTIFNFTQKQKLKRNIFKYK